MTAMTPNPSKRTRTVTAWLDGAEAELNDPGNLQHLRRIAAADADLTAAVQAARQHGEPWTLIGMALDMSRDEARQRFDQEG